MLKFLSGLLCFVLYLGLLCMAGLAALFVEVVGNTIIWLDKNT